MPRSFCFPLAQAHGGDEHYGHKHFLANVVWACTDRLLKRNDEEGGIGAVFEYLDSRRRLNVGRHRLDVIELAERATGWLEQSAPLDMAVEQFREMYGPEPFSWVLGDLVAEQ